MSVLGLSTEWDERIFQSIIVRSKNENVKILANTPIASKGHTYLVIPGPLLALPIGARLDSIVRKPETVWAHTTSSGSLLILILI